MRRLALAAAAVLLLAGCPAEEDPAAPPVEPTPTPEPPGEEPEEEVELTQECTNPDGFTISYPEGWVTNEDAVNGLAPCSVFDPESVEMDETMHVPENIAVFAQIDAVEFQDSPDPQFEEELDRRETTIDGRDAVRLETEATGEGFFDAGHVLTTWRVDLDGAMFTAVTHDVGDVDYQGNQDVLDAMVQSVQFDV